MKRLTLFLGMVIFLSLCFQNTSYSQLKGFKKLKKAAQSILEDDKKEEKKQTNPSNTGDGNSVRGKKLAPPSVDSHLNNAKAALGDQRWSEARFEVKEAMRGVEIELGYKILESMPKSVKGVSHNPDDDGVVSTGVGFVGMVVSRFYGNDGKQYTATVGNNSALGISYNFLLNSGYSSNDGNHKNVTVQGNRGTMTFDGYNTYNLGVPFGQSSAFVLECRECTSEDDIMAAVEAFDINAFEEILKDDSSDGSETGDAKSHLSAASSKYSAKNLEGSRFDLQRTLVDIDIVIGEKILAMLPDELAGLKVTKEDDEHVGSASGFAGVYVRRIYESPDGTKSVELSLLDDSPLLSVVSGFLSSPLLIGMSGKKSINIDGYKGMKETVEGSDPIEHNINIPFNQSMLSMNFVNISENDVTKSSNEVPVGEIFDLIK
ncbi:MAG: hypothetical protein AAFN93_02345 [Bacteroidota bacterium]